MRKKPVVIGLAVGVMLLGLGVTVYAQRNKNVENFAKTADTKVITDTARIVTDASQSNSPSTGSSNYIDYSAEALAKAESQQTSGQKIVLFFHASWCPYCIAADKNFKSTIGTAQFPSNTTVLKVDYDTQIELKKKYGITHQHTFVQIDSQGNQITKWISGESKDLITHIQ